jgi:hypothetical protein
MGFQQKKKERKRHGIPPATINKQTKQKIIMQRVKGSNPIEMLLHSGLTSLISRSFGKSSSCAGKIK